MGAPEATRRRCPCTSTSQVGSTSISPKPPPSPTSSSSSWPPSSISAPASSCVRSGSWRPCTSVRHAQTKNAEARERRALCDHLPLARRRPLPALLVGDDFVQAALRMVHVARHLDSAPLHPEQLPRRLVRR